MDKTSQITTPEFQILNKEIGDIKTLMNKMVEAIGKIALLEERQQTVANTTDKILDRIERVESRQHESDLAAAGTQQLLGRLDELSKSVGVLNIEREKDKARIQTLLWTVRALWVVGGSSVGLFVIKLATTGAFA